MIRFQPPQVMLILTVLFICPTGGTAEETTGNRDEERAKRLAYLTELAEEFEMMDATNEAVKLELQREPLIRYSNPVRNSFSDGGIFLWRHEKAPAVLGAISVRGTGYVFVEFTALASVPINCGQGGNPMWTPVPDEQVDVQLTGDAPLTGDAKRGSLVMRRLARRFSVSMFEQGGSDEKKMLRLLTSPLVSWFDEESGTYGSCFAYAESTDPEALVLIRYNPESDSEDAKWTYTLARMTSRPLTFSLDGKIIHEITGYWPNPKSPRDRYVERRIGTYEDG